MYSNTKTSLRLLHFILSGRSRMVSHSIPHARRRRTSQISTRRLLLAVWPKIRFKSGQFKVVNVISSRAGRRRGDWWDPGAGCGGKETPACSRVMESQQNATRVDSVSSGQRRSRSPQRGRSAGSQRSVGSDKVGEKQITASAVFQRIKSSTEPVDEATKHEALRALEDFDIFRGEGSVPRFQLFPEHLVAHAPGYWRIDAWELTLGRLAYRSVVLLQRRLSDIEENVVHEESSPAGAELVEDGVRAQAVIANSNQPRPLMSKRATFSSKLKVDSPCAHR